MKTRGKVILVTGAGSGIGRYLTIELSKEKCSFILVGRNQEALVEVGKFCRENGSEYKTLLCDLRDLASLERLKDLVLQSYGHIDILINNAGVLTYQKIENQNCEDLENLYRCNVLAPIQLSSLLLPELKKRDEALIVNTGSIFGSIAFPYFSAYSSSKFALRGFSESLRRELEDSSVRVLYVAPRATQTKLANLFGEMAKATSMRLDPPELVAKKIATAIRKNKKDLYIGFPECVFVRLNSLLPRLVDKALVKQARIMESFAK